MGGLRSGSERRHRGYIVKRRRRPVEAVDGVGLGRHIGDEVNDEVSFHIEERTAELIATGLATEQARAKALEEFGPIVDAKRAMRRSTQLRRRRRARFEFIDGLIQDVQFALRGIRRNRTFAVVVAVTVAIGIAGTTVAMSIGNGVLLASPPIPEAHRMASIWELRSGDIAESMEGRLIHYDRYTAYAEATADVFTGLAAHSYAHLSVSSPEGAVAAEGFLTSGNYFDVLRLNPLLGRLYRTDHERSVVISERLWRSRFGGDPGVVGGPIRINSRPFLLVGVAPRDFVGTTSMFTGDVFLPAVAYAEARQGAIDNSENPGAAVRPSLVVPIGRLRDDLEWDQAAARVNELAPLVRPEEDGHLRVRGAQLDGIRWRTDLLGYLHAGVGTLLGAAGMLLLVACANIAGIVLARVYDRRREVALRVAIGAGRGRIVRQMVTENLVLFMAGGIGGVALAWTASRAMAGVELPLNATITLDIATGLPVTVYGLLVAFILGIGFGLVPGRQAARLDLTTSLKEGGHSAGPRQKHWFVVGQMALASLLLIIAGLATRSFLRILDVDLGMDPRGMLVATLDVSSHGYDEAEGTVFFDELLRRTRALPGVEGASLAEFVVLRGSSASNGARAVTEGDDSPSLGVYRNVVDADYLAVNRLRLLSGRFITREDVAESPPVAVINETLARQMWPGLDPIGRSFQTAGRTHEVVGVVADGVYSFTFEDPKRYALFASTQRYRGSRTLHVRAGDLTSTAAAVRSIVQDLDPEIAIQALAPMVEVVEGNRFLPRFLSRLTGAFAVTGLVLAALGVYGMLSVYVARRKRELAVRVSVGAGRREILALVLGRGVLLASLGSLLGVAAAFAVARLLSSLLYGIRPFDWLTFLTIPLLLVTVAALASLIPAQRAARVDPRAILQDV